MSFPLYLDENVNPLIAVLLRAAGYDVVSARDAGMAQRRIDDPAQLEFATSDGRAIVTHNRDDFSRLAKEWFEAGRPHGGIIVTPMLPPRLVAERIRVLAEKYPDGIENLFLFA